MRINGWSWYSKLLKEYIKPSHDLKNAFQKVKDVSGKTLKSLDETISLLRNREKYTYEIKSIENLEIIPKGTKLTLGVEEVGEHLESLKKGGEEVNFFISRFVFGHLASFLKIPSRMYDYYQRFLELKKNDFDFCCEKEGEILKTLFQDRIEDRKKKPNFITTFKDDFGFYPRVIHSSVYYPYRDSKALDIMLKGFNSINIKYPNMLKYEFEKAFITPYKTSMYFLNRLTHTQPNKVGEEKFKHKVKRSV